MRLGFYQPTSPTPCGKKNARPDIDEQPFGIFKTIFIQFLSVISKPTAGVYHNLTYATIVSSTARKQKTLKTICSIVGFFNNERYHEHRDNLKPADIYFGKVEEVKTRREEIKRKTLRQRCCQNLQLVRV
jgi:hypothetical protein